MHYIINYTQSFISVNYGGFSIKVNENMTSKIRVSYPTNKKHFLMQKSDLNEQI